MNEEQRAELTRLFNEMTATETRYREFIRTGGRSNFNENPWAAREPSDSPNGYAVVLQMEAAIAERRFENYKAKLIAEA